MSLHRPAHLRADRRTTPPPAPTPVVARARRLLLGLYLLLGLTVSNWLARLPTVRDSLDLTTGELGLILLVGAVGSLLTVLGAGAFMTRFGSVRTLITAAVVFSVANALLGLGPTVGSVGVLVIGVVLMSASFALGNVPMNVESVVIERGMGRTVVPQFHAAFSVGSVLGSVIGAAASWGHVPLLVQFGAVSVVTLVWRVRAVPGAVLPLPPAPAPRDEMTTVRDETPAVRAAGLRQALGAWRERRTLVVGVVVMAAALSEGSANNWLAIAVVDGFAQTEAVAAMVFGLFVASMTVARVLGTWLIDAFGRVAVLTASGVVSLAGLVIFGLSPSLPLAALGVVCWGLGVGLVVPIGMTAVSFDPLRAPGRVAVVSAFASVSSIAAPPLIGLAAEGMGARHALLLICVVLVAGTVLSREAGAPDPEPLVVPDAPVDPVAHVVLEAHGVPEPARLQATTLPGVAASGTGNLPVAPRPHLTVPDTLHLIGSEHQLTSEASR